MTESKVVTSASPYGIVKHRAPEGRIRHDRRIDRYWKSRATGITVEVRRYLCVANDNVMKVIFFDPSVNHELSCEEQQFRKDFEPRGNFSSKF